MRRSSVFVHSIGDKLGKGPKKAWKNLWDTRGISAYKTRRNRGQAMSYPHLNDICVSYPLFSPKQTPNIISKLSTLNRFLALDQNSTYYCLSPVSTAPITTTTINIYKN